MQEENTLKLDDEPTVYTDDPSKFAFLPETERDLIIVGDTGHTVVTVTPKGEVLLGEKRLPLEEVLEGLKNAVAAVEVLRDTFKNKTT